MDDVNKFAQQLMLNHNISYSEAYDRSKELYDAVKLKGLGLLSDGWVSIEDKRPKKNKPIIVRFNSDKEIECFIDGEMMLTYEENASDFYKLIAYWRYDE